MGKKRVVVCAAIRNSSGVIICSARHFDALMHRQIQEYARLYDIDSHDYVTTAEIATPRERRSTHFIYLWSKAEQGFIDQYCVFMTREEAYTVAIESGQYKDIPSGGQNKLYSENLY